ncbi:MAG TPA: glycosyltransferase family 4 protein [Solirubrobacteraceae bacterium]|nr:glycosyltransferase family 4 protein [Solirubrobacteraceae bacterium]
MPGRSLHIAWLGPDPVEGPGVPGVAAELLHGLAGLGHRIDCFYPAAEEQLPPAIEQHPNITATRGTNRWQWDRWYSRTRFTAFATGMLAAAFASLRLRRQIVRRHRQDPYDVIYQFSTIESPAVPSALTRTVPLVIHPETHSAGELRSLIAERALSLRCQPRWRFAMVLSVMLTRSLVQRFRIRRATLLVCISAVFRDHMVRDYSFPASKTIVVPNPVRLERFAAPAGELSRPAGHPPVMLVLGRVVVRKGVESVIALAHTLLERGAAVRIRIVGGPSLWSDYTRLLEDLPRENAEYVGKLPGPEIPGELAAADLLLQASRYEPFGLTVAEALAAGVPVLGTTEVGALEGVDRSVAIAVAPGDVEAMAGAVEELLARLAANPAAVRSTACAEARRLFAPEVVCAQISTALERLVDGAARASGEPQPMATAARPS